MSARSWPVLLACACVLIASVQCIYRLPKNVKPKHYELTMEAQLQDDEDMSWERTPFNGSVSIDLVALETGRVITFHSKHLVIDFEQVELTDSQGRVQKAASHSTNGQQQTETVSFPENLIKDASYTLNIGSFSGYLGNGEGFFLAKYEINDTLSRRIAVTHFEPTGARKAFPCFDEPAMKATFRINLIRKGSYNSISNEGLEKTEDLGNDRFKDTFKLTPPMSTFTVAFAVSDFPTTPWLEGHRVQGRPSQIQAGDGIYARDIGIQTLKKLVEYTGVEYPISKMEQFGVPDGYFFNHAMENYGLVIYGEPHLLRNNKSRDADIKRTTVYISHEFAHQWFGNLVTPQWWDYLWLSESYAAYCQYFIAQFIKPSWQLMDQFIIDVVRKAFHQEQFNQAAPLNFPIRYIGQYPPFHIMYEKGATTVRMISHFLTAENLQKGLQLYFTTHKYGNTYPSDMYASYQKVLENAGQTHLLGNNTVQQILSTWDSNEGYPIVHVTRDYATGELALEQENTFDDEVLRPKKTWNIPINWAFSRSEDLLDFSKTTADYWMAGKSETVNRDFPKDGWLVINKQQTGYYRVNYDRENWERLIAVLNSDNFTQIHPLSRAQLIDDSFNLAYRKMIPYDIPLRLCDYVNREREYVPLVSFIDAIGTYINIYQWGGQSIDYFQNYTLANAVTNTSVGHYEKFKAYVKQNLFDVFHYFKNKSEDSDTVLQKLTRSKLHYYRYYFQD